MHTARTSLFTWCLFLLCIQAINAQNFTSYFTGSTIDTISNPQGGICLMGGATESDPAMVWFLERANGGDILVLRASGSDGYNEYLFSELGVTVNSVETIVFNDATASDEVYIQDKIQNAEAIWFAGGDQWDYISYWRNTKIDSLINDALQNRNIVIGGTSAGMAIQGAMYFSAENGTVSSGTALTNPYDSSVKVDTTSFLRNRHLENVITDTHYDNPDRKGRHATFMARALKDYGINAKGIACEEFTAVCIDEHGIARVFGDFPNNEDAAYFLQVNCNIPNNTPENCNHGVSLTWNQNEQAIKVFKILGTTLGDNSFDLNDWQSGFNGNWEDWSILNGTLETKIGLASECPATTNAQNMGQENLDIKIYPCPADNYLIIQGELFDYSIELFDFLGRKVFASKHFKTQIDIANLSSGMYTIRLLNEVTGDSYSHKIIKQ